MLLLFYRVLAGDATHLVCACACGELIANAHHKEQVKLRAGLINKVVHVWIMIFAIVNSMCDYFFWVESKVGIRYKERHRVDTT